MDEQLKRDAYREAVRVYGEEHDRPAFQRTLDLYHRRLIGASPGPCVHEADGTTRSVTPSDLTARWHGAGPPPKPNVYLPHQLGGLLAGPHPGEVWLHVFTGTAYLVLGLVWLEAEAALAVLYQRNGAPQEPVWARAVFEWHMTLASNGRRRFELIT